MKKILTGILLTVCHFAFTQGNTLYNALLLKPKIGQAVAFENAWKAHVAKFHKGDDQRFVYEIISGELSGYYQLVDGPSSYADMDKVNPKNAAHDLDYNTTVASKVENEMGGNIYRMVDSLCYNPDVKADKYLYTVYNLKTGKMPDLMAEVRRATAVNKSINSQSSSTVFVKQMAGSSPQMITVSNLKDGFKQLEQNYFAGQADKFKQSYISMHGQEAWDKRLVLLQEITNSYQSYMVKFRPDLSSK